MIVKRFRIGLLIIITIFITRNCYSQTTTIDFNNIPYYRLGDLHYFDNSGCRTWKKFGTNPVPLNGHNIRTVGYTWLSDPWTGLGALNMYAIHSPENDSYENCVLSIEYPFEANKTYLVEIHGVNDMIPYIESSTRPSYYINGVFWVKLENSAVISPAPQNPCEEYLYPVEKKIDRYSKLIADPNKAIETKTYRVKFSPLVNKSGLKIIYDGSPVGSDVYIEQVFRLINVKIQVLPYEEDNSSRPFYDNYVADDGGHRNRTDPNFQIPYERPPRQTPPTRPVGKNFTIAPNQWRNNPDGRKYVILADLFPEINTSQVTLFQVYGGNYFVGTREYREQFELPGTYQNNTYSFEVFQGQVFLYCSNPTNILPSNDVDFYIAYWPL